MKPLYNNKKGKFIIAHLKIICETLPRSQVGFTPNFSKIQKIKSAVNFTNLLNTITNYLNYLQIKVNVEVSFV